MMSLLLAIALQLDYTVKGSPRELAIKEPAQVKAILKTLKIVGHKTGLEIPIEPFGSVTFTLEDKSTETGHFVTDTLLYFPGKGLVTVPKEFYLKLCNVAAKHAGRPIELVKNNQ